jgi:hypothetical protein
LKILKNPILLPCEHAVCREHLAERDVVTENRIKCKEYNGEFGVKDNHFKSIKAFTKLIESQSYLNDEEKSLKHEIEDSFRTFFQFYDEFVQNRSKLESDVFDHFHEMCFQVDEHREKLKERIDEIALAMIEEIKKHEEAYLKNLKKHFSTFDESKSKEKKLKELDETFRDPNLLIQTIQLMRTKQEESLKDIQVKLNEINQIKDDLKATNEFKPNSSSFNQKDMSLFGLLKLNDYSNSFKSQILKDEQQCLELIYLCQFSPNDKWSLLYRVTRDGFGSKDFHSKCDGHSNTLTLIKAKESSYIFGGFTSVRWKSYARGRYKLDPNPYSV